VVGLKFWLTTGKRYTTDLIERRRRVQVNLAYND